MQEEKKQIEVVYEAPAIIFEGDVSTRAGSPINDEALPVDPSIDLFGD